MVVVCSNDIFSAFKVDAFLELDENARRQERFSVRPLQIVNSIRLLPNARVAKILLTLFYDDAEND